MEEEKPVPQNAEAPTEPDIQEPDPAEPETPKDLQPAETPAEPEEEKSEIKKPDLKAVKNPIELVRAYWGEIRVAIILVVPMQIIQFIVYLIVTDKYPSVNWPMFVVGICLIGFVSFLFLDKKARDEDGASAGAFEAATGYMWILFTLLFSLIGMLGQNLLESVCKKASCFALATSIGSFRSYALYILFEGLAMGAIVIVLAMARRKQEIESRKSASIEIAKPKKR